MLEIRGISWALTTVAVWAGWVVATRHAVLDSSLNAFDLVAICYGVSGLLSLPIFLRRLSRRELPRSTIQLGIFVGYGAPYRLVATAGFIFAPASHGAALTPGVLPFFAAIYAMLLFGERLTRQRVFGLALILAGVVMIGGNGLWFAPGTQRIGHALFLFGSLLLATYGAVLQRNNVSALDGAMIVAVYSMLLYCPIYFSIRGAHIFSVAWPVLLLHSVIQGLIAGILSVLVYGRAIALLGNAAAATFMSLMPATVTLLGLFVVGERPGPLEICGIAAVSLGVFLVSAPATWLRHFHLGRAEDAQERSTSWTSQDRSGSEIGASEHDKGHSRGDDRSASP
jgi:drug/metabolite transporter (DMT)-like permease